MTILTPCRPPRALSGRRSSGRRAPSTGSEIPLEIFLIIHKIARILAIFVRTFTPLFIFMRIFTFFVLFFMSIATFAQGPSEPSEKRFAASMKKDVKNLILEGKNEVKTIKDRELNRYFVALLKDKENIINGTLGLSSGYYGDKTQAQRRDFYQNILK